MKERDYLSNILAGNGFTWVQLNSVSSYVRGLTYNKASESRDGNGYKVLRANNITLSQNMLNFEDVKVVKFDTKVKSSQKLHKNDILISAASGSRDHVGKVAFINTDMDYYFGGFMGVVRSTKEINPRFLFHILRSRIFQDYLNEMLNSSTINNLSSSVMNGFQIPIPCPENPEKSLQIQAEIVRILDAFTSLTAELTAELTARKKQYNYYRDKLLSFDDGEVEWKPLGADDIGKFIRGGGLQKKDFTETGVGCIHYGQIYTHYGTYANTTKTCVSEAFAQKAKKAHSGDLVIATTSENDDDVCKAVAWLGSEDIAVSSDACIYRHNLNPKYVSYFFQTEHFQKQKRPFITGTKVRRVNADNLAKILIPVPRMQEQERIVSILDKFDALTNSITEGLPREIELRQKQYEYYRDLLLSFPKPDEEAA
jgi:Restriction endonuclease S subunits